MSRLKNIKGSIFGRLTVKEQADGTKEDPKRCVEEVPYGGSSVLFHQCLRKRGYGPKEEYCKQHAKKLAQH